jgi:nucleoside-diphosphate-sugar epimerase
MTRGLILVTGAAGTVGRYVVGELLAQGFSVRATDIACSGGEFALTNGNYSYKSGDLTDEEFVKEITDGVEAVINLAAVIDVALPWNKVAPINLDAVGTLYWHASETGAKIFVHASSGSIYAPTNKLRGENSRIKTKAEASPYEWSKILSEQRLHLDRAARKINGQKAAEIVIIRPALIYGPGNRFLAAVYLAIAIMLHELCGNRAPLLKGGPKTNMVHAEDVARATVFCMQSAAAWGHTFNVADDDPLGFGDQVTAMAHGFGFKTDGPMIPLPGPGVISLAAPVYNRAKVLSLLNRVLGFEWERIGKAHGIKPPFEPSINTGMTPFFGSHTIFGNEKIKAAGFRFKHSRFAEGFRGVAKWYQDNGWAPKP